MLFIIPPTGCQEIATCLRNKAYIRVYIASHIGDQNAECTRHNIIIFEYDKAEEFPWKFTYMVWYSVVVFRLSVENGFCKFRNFKKTMHFIRFSACAIFLFTFSFNMIDIHFGLSPPLPFCV